MPGNGTVRAYTLQSAAAWDLALERGYMTGSRDHVDEHDLGPYLWMVEQMGLRIDGHSGDFPIWAFFHRPNMRQRPFFDAPTVLIVADVPRSRMLISDFDLWHDPLNSWYCALTHEESDAFDGSHVGGTGPAFVTDAMRSTWERVFDLAPRPPEVLRFAGPGCRLQACIDRITIDEVVSVTPVTGRKGRNGGRPW